MFYLSENLKKYRIMNNLTQEDVAEYLGVTPQSVSKWERNECYPDVTLLPALANVFETSIDFLIGMDAIRAQEARYNIHKKATEYQRNGDYVSAEREYREALRIYPKDSGMLLGLAGVLALKGDSEEAIALIERSLPLSDIAPFANSHSLRYVFIHLYALIFIYFNSLGNSLSYREFCKN